MTTVRLYATPLGRGQLALIGALIVLAAVGWAVTGDRMAGMDHGPGTDPGALGFFLTAWVVMMGAMMFPSIAPMVIAYERIRVRRRELGKSSPAAGTVLFVAGYLVAWTTVGLLGFAIYETAASVAGDELAWDNAGRWLAGGLILAAAVWELTPAKDVCLRKCRTPFDFLFGGWRDGGLGALRLGVEHGAWCIGCCWGLMLALFALGVMSVGWMAFIAALIAAEKLIPGPRRVLRVGVAALLVALGLSVALVPERVPGLTIPGSHAAHHGGMNMGGHGGATMKEHQGGAAREEHHGGATMMEPHGGE
jgi:predicted metal-binding membrane protein